MSQSTISRSKPFRPFAKLLGCLGVVLAMITASGSSGHREHAASEQKDSEARYAMDRADKLRADWTKDSLQKAADEYEKATLIWTSVSDFVNAAEAALKAGDVYFVFNEYAQALKRYQNAELFAGKVDDWLVKADALSRMGRLQSFIGNNELAGQQLTKALYLFREHEANRNDRATNAYGEVLSNLAEVSYAKGDFVKAREQLKSALEVFHNNPQGEAKAHLFNGYITGSVGDPAKGSEEIARALELYRQVNDKIGEGLALTALATPFSFARKVNRASQLYNEALEIFRAVGDRHSAAIALVGLGQAYEGVGDYKLAINYYDQALKLFEEIGSVDAISIPIFRLAWTHNLNGQPDQALAFYERGVRLCRAAGKVRTEANTLGEIARIYASQGRRGLASRQYERTRKFYEAIGDLQGQATALNAYGDFLLELGQNEKAIGAYQKALPLSEAGEQGIRMSIFYNLARANLKTGALEVALSYIRQSLAIIEDLRANVTSPEFRVSYFSGVEKHYKLCIEILMQLERLQPGKGFAVEALQESERGRARLLLDLIRESRAKLRDGAANELLVREGELRKLLELQAQHAMDLSLKRRDATEIAEVEDQQAQLRAEYQEVQAKLREQNPRLFSLEQFPPLTLQKLQNELRDSDTMLLEYSLGDEHSYLWAVTSDSFHSYELPPGEILEDAVREFYKLITARQETDGQGDNDYQANVQAADKVLPEKATRLSQMLLTPVAEQLGNRRLVVVTEGALQYLPFEALPVPIAQTSSRIGIGAISEPLLTETNEIVILPSASTLLAIRSARNPPSSPDKLVAVIADPVFSRNDERVQTEPPPSSAAVAATDKNLHQSLPQAPESLTSDRELVRLAHASEEADAIYSVAPWGTSMVAKGFDASRETVMSSDVGQYQILHFATHGFLDTEQPELSSIVLTSVDRNGEKTNGLMPLHDIYSLNLSAEVTVLSACQTALGKEVKGEGLVGLTHSFMSAGSKSVVASLWKVDDRATAVLMADFYEGMLQKGMTPSAALRSAKLKMMRDKQWNAPYYWAGFVLQGEYTNHIAVDRRPWLRPGTVLFILLSLIAVVLLILRKRKHRVSAGQFT